MLAGQDRIVDNTRTLEYFDRIAGREKTLISYPEAHHTLEFEPDPARYADDLIGWLGGLIGPNFPDFDRVERLIGDPRTSPS